MNILALNKDVWPNIGLPFFDADHINLSILDLWNTFEQWDDNKSDEEMLESRPLCRPEH